MGELDHAPALWLVALPDCVVGSQGFTVAYERSFCKARPKRPLAVDRT